MIVVQRRRSDGGEGIEAVGVQGGDCVHVNAGGVLAVLHPDRQTMLAAYAAGVWLSAERAPESDIAAK